MKVIETRAIAAVLRHNDQAAAAAEIGRTPRQLRTILRRPHVAAELRRRGRELIQGTMLALASSGSDAREVLVAIAKDEKAKVSARVTAARAVIELSQRGAELADLEELLGELETRTAHLPLSREPK